MVKIKHRDFIGAAPVMPCQNSSETRISKIKERLWNLCKKKIRTKNQTINWKLTRLTLSIRKQTRKRC